MNSLAANHLIGITLKDFKPIEEIKIRPHINIGWGCVGDRYLRKGRLIQSLGLEQDFLQATESSLISKREAQTKPLRSSRLCGLNRIASLR